MAVRLTTLLTWGYGEAARRIEATVTRAASASPISTEESPSLADIFLRPQPVLRVGGTVLALVAIRRGRRAGRPLALVARGLVALGFVLSHGIPAETERIEPYWGDGSADVLQWLGVLAILACCAAVIVLARRLPRAAAARPTAARAS